MKRPPGLWILLSAGVLWLSLQDVYGIRATALIFGKSTTSTSTTTEATSSVKSDDETAINTESTNGTVDANNSTGPILTGNPQIDYLLDPNLPQVLNGYNLSEYPFYERVPANIEKEIDFKCDGLHDGFYASVPHKCQVYHHCLFGTRYDFLCANYTAFDMQTFICQFVSIVDCVNSKKYWHRNDALYEAASTTTGAPLRASIYTTAPPDVGQPITPRRPAGGARRPYRPRRRRPQVEYYDDEYYDEEYYDERPRSTRGRKRPRPRPRPAYDDEEEEYEDERYESRRGGGRRRPYRKRTQERKKPEYVEEEDEEVEDKFEDEDFVAGNKRQKNDDKRKPPIEDEERDQKRPAAKRRNPTTEKRDQDSDYDRKSARKGSGNRRPITDDYEDELPQSDDSRKYEQRPRKKPKTDESADGRPIITPKTGTIYDRPRVAPRINLPVPKNAADKYAFKSAGGGKITTTTKAPPAAEEDDYLEEQYDEPLPKRQRNRDRRPVSEGKREKTRSEDSRDEPSATRPRTRKPEVQESAERTTVKSKYSSGRNRYPRPTLPTKKKPASDEYYDEEEYLDEEKEVQERRPSLKFERKSTSTTTSTTTTTTTTTTVAPKVKDKQEPVMRIIKRPFLPSRGGSPYNSRGLQPVGLKALDQTSEENDPKNENGGDADKEEEADDYEDSRSEENPIKEPQEEVQTSRRPLFKPSPVMIKVPIRSKYTPPSAEAQELIDSEPLSQQQTYKTRDFPNSRTTSRPKVIEKNPLDLDEYDVTLNDALNPTLPNLPVRAFPTGFSSANDYNYNTFSRPRYVLEPVISPSNKNYVQSNKVVRSQQRYETVPLSQYSTINGGDRQPAQTQAIYSSY